MRILIVNPFGIGDVLFSTPLISNLRIACPESYIAYICNVRAKDVLYSNPDLNKIFVFEKDEHRKLWSQSKLQTIKKFILFLLQIRKEKFDLVIDLSLGHQYSLFLMLIGVRMRIGYDYRNRGRFLTHKINIVGYEDKPIADYYLDLLRFLDIKPKRVPLTMNILGENKERADEFFKNNNLKEQDLIVGIIPAGGASWGRNFSYRHWPWQHYAELANMLISNLGAKVILFGDLSEREICQKIKGAMREKPIDACGKTSLKQFAALLSRCNLVVCNDGGPLHVAVSQDVKTVSVFGPVDQKVYGPYPPSFKHMVVTKSIACRPCYRKFKLALCRSERRCIRSILAQEVFDVIKASLGKKV